MYSKVQLLTREGKIRAKAKRRKKKEKEKNWRKELEKMNGMRTAEGRLNGSKAKMDRIIEDWAACKV